MSKTIKNITLGADPELFLKKDGEVISAEGLIGGTKYEPKIISDEGHAIQEDNIMVEFNIPASDSLKSFTDNINYVLEYLKTHAKQFDCELEIAASSLVDKKYLNTKQAKLFGCEPDYNVYLKQVNESPSSKTNLRTCGGHIHVGYKNPTLEVSEKIIYAMDITLGLESVNLDKDDRRRIMYGKAGCFRIKDYGVEYRTLSNFWIMNDELIKWAYDKTMEALELVNSGIIDSLIEKFDNQVKECIDFCDKEKSLKLLKEISTFKIQSLVKK